MNATARTLLIAAAAIAAACWAVPAFLVGAVPPDAGMFAMMALLYALLVARGARGRLRPPVSPRGRGQPGYRVLRHRLRCNRLRRHGPACQHGQAVLPTTLNQMPIKGRTGPSLSVRLSDLRCAYQIFGAPVNHFPFGLSCSGAPKFSKCSEDEMRCALGAQRFKELGAYRANQRGPHIGRTSLQSHHDS